MITKATFVGEGFTRKPPKFERFIRPTVSTHIIHEYSIIECGEFYSLTCAVSQGLRVKKAHVTHPELKATFCLPILGVKKNPTSPMYTQLGVLTKGTVIEVGAGAKNHLFDG